MKDGPANPGSSPEESVFSAALEISPGPVREAYLDRACAHDPALRDRVKELLRAHEALGKMGEKPGDPFGPYVLVEKIGQGAFGSVWRARQEQPLRREVALKLINWGMDTRQVLLRFEAERQVLAMLEHENIAKIFDAGASGQGRPYFVMELVRGPKITDYCDRHRLSTAARLLLFTQVCRGLQHAHAKGVVHRDIKPSNILVSEHCGVPSPKIIDFGIAKATGRRLTEATLHTAAGQVMGTLSYMSPEQTALGGAAVDARSDVYSLGALLYELLVGRPPVTEMEFEKMFFDDVVRTIRKKHPPRPSERLAALTPQEREVVAQRQDTNSAKLAELLRHDLDWVTVRCLEKDPRHRYQNAGELAERLAAHLDHRPVSNLIYRLRHWLRRHELALGLAGTALVLLALLWHWNQNRPAPWEIVPIKVTGYAQPWQRHWNRLNWYHSEGWLAGGYDEDSATGKFLGRGALLHTWNAGQNWQEVALTNSDAGAGTLAHFIGQTWDGIGPVTDVRNIRLIPPNGAPLTNTWIAAMTGIYLSTNALSPHPQWRRQTPAPDQLAGYSEFGGLVDVDSGNQFYAYGWQGIAHWQQGGGWQVQLGTYNYAIMGLSVVNKWQPDLWAVANFGGNDDAVRSGAADYGAIFHLTRSDGHWERVPLTGVTFQPGQTLNAIATLPLSESVVAVGVGGLVLHSHRSGSNWVWRSTAPTRSNLNDIILDHRNILWAIGSGGTVLKSADAGETWTVQPCRDAAGRTIQADFHRFSLDDADQAWVFGEGGIYKSRLR